jgi:amino acid transporter
MGVMESISNVLIGLYSRVLDIFPESAESAIRLFFFAVIIALVALFIWRFYKSLSKRTLITLNLNQYNRSEHPFLSKFFAVLLYLIEYVIIMPVIIFIWFGALTVIILLIAKETQKA